MSTSFRASGEFYPSIWDYVEARTGQRVLLGESDAELRHFFAVTLRRRGYAVIASATGAETLATLSSVSRCELPRPDAVIMNLVMPVHSGFDLLAAMRRAGWCLPVILVSTGLDDRARALVSRLGVAACLTRPVSSAKLSHALEAALAPV